MVAVVVAAEDELVELEPVLDGVAGGAQADDRFAGLDVSLHLAKLPSGELHSACEDDHEIRLAKRVEAWEAVFPLANDRGAAIAVLLFQLLGEFGQRGRRAVQRLATEQDDVRLGFSGLKVGRAQKKPGRDEGKSSQIFHKQKRGSQIGAAKIPHDSQGVQPTV